MWTLLTFCIFRYPYVALEGDGRIYATQCSCEQKSDGRCSHVACLLFLIEELSIGRQPVISKPSTSQPQKWGQGSKTKKNPAPIHQGKYSKSQPLDKHIHRDPRPVELQRTTTEELNSFLIEQQRFPCKTLWSDIPIHYENFALTERRKNVLLELTDTFLQAQSSQVDSIPDDRLSTAAGKHISGTEAQSKCALWNQFRKFRVTASKFHDFHKCPNQLTKKMLWEDEPNISKLPAVKWGLGNEKRALEDFKLHGNWGEIQECGLFVSRKHPFLGASPDAIGSSFLVEIKCPYILRSTTPFDFTSLSQSQESSFFCKRSGNKLSLKRTHKYYWQVQCQMFVTGIHQTYFVV